MKASKFSDAQKAFILKQGAARRSGWKWPDNQDERISPGL